MKRPGLPRLALALSAALMAAGCDNAEPTPAPTETGFVPYVPEPSRARRPAPLASDIPELSSKDCIDVVRFYFEAIGDRAYDRAAVVWNDPVIDGARLRTTFRTYQEPLFEWTEPYVEETPRVLHCTAGGTLFDARNPAKPVVQGTLTLRRANDVPGATPAELRWTLQSSTFVEELRRSEGE